MIWWLIYNHDEIEPNRRYIQFYYDACNRRNIELRLIDRELLSVMADKGTYFCYDGFRTDVPKVAINRTRDYDLARSLEYAGCRLYNNPEVTLLGNNKLLAIQHVAALGLRTMKTCNDRLELDYPYVAKSIDGHGGTEVFLIQNKDDELRYAEEFSTGKYIYQEFCSEPGRDLRVYIVGDQIVAGMLRVSDTDFRSNYCLGGRAERYELSEEEKNVVYTIINSLHIGHCGIDFIFDKGKIVFNEIEDVVGSRMLYSTTDIDVVDLYVDYVFNEIRDKNDL